jgi:hypothetical protein
MAQSDVRIYHSVPDYVLLKKILSRRPSEDNEYAAMEASYSLHGPLPLSLWQKIEKLGYFELKQQLIEAELDQPWVGISRENALTDLMTCFCKVTDYCRFCARARRFGSPKAVSQIDCLEEDLAQFCFRLGLVQRKPSIALRAEISKWLLLVENRLSPSKFDQWRTILKACGY